MPLISCGRCSPCLRGDRHLCVRMACTGLSYAWGALAELAIVPAYQLTPIPDSLTLEQGALIEPTAVAVYAVERARIEAGADVLITGAGPIGALCVLALRVQSMLVGAELESRRSRTRPGCGAGLGSGVRRRRGGRQRRDRGQWRRSSHRMLGHRRWLQSVCRCGACGRGRGAGRPAHSEPSRRSDAVVSQGPQHRGTWAYPVTAWPRIARLIARGALPAERVVTRRADLESVVADGFDALIDPSGTQMKVLVSHRDGEI